MQLMSSAFTHEGAIPAEYTCDGSNISPPLQIRDVPSAAKSLVLICDDPDVPKSLRPDGLFVHWVVFNIPPTLQEIPKNSRPFGIVGNNTLGRPSYTGPCPPDREHRYFFKLYALNTQLSLKEGASKEEVEKAMQSHLLTQAVLMGTYCRAQNVKKGGCGCC